MDKNSIEKVLKKEGTKKKLLRYIVKRLLKDVDKLESECAELKVDNERLLKSLEEEKSKVANIQSVYDENMRKKAEEVTKYKEESRLLMRKLRGYRDRENQIW